MILFLLLLIVACGIVAVYAASGNAGTHDVTLWQWHWSAVPDWVPVVITAAVFAAVMILYMVYSGVVHGVRVGSMRRRVTTRESAITDLRRENQRLREENARVRSELHGMDRGVAATTGAITAADREPVAARTVPDRSRSGAAYRPRATFGERVRAFFSGREPAGY
jgi:cell division protein FtsB